MKQVTIVAMAGTELWCPNCHATIGVLRKTLFQGWTFGLDAIRFHKGQEPRAGKAECRICNTPYAEIDHHHTASGSTQTMRLCTAYGWVPPRPTKACAKQSH